MWNFAFDEGYAANKEKSNPVGLLRSLGCLGKKDAVFRF
jgi:hypothetical protein